MEVCSRSVTEMEVQYADFRDFGVLLLDGRDVYGYGSFVSQCAADGRGYAGGSLRDDRRGQRLRLHQRLSGDESNVVSADHYAVTMAPDESLAGF